MKYPWLLASALLVLLAPFAFGEETSSGTTLQVADPVQMAALAEGATCDSVGREVTTWLAGGCVPGGFCRQQQDCGNGDCGLDGCICASSCIPGLACSSQSDCGDGDCGIGGCICADDCVPGLACTSQSDCGDGDCSSLSGCICS